MISLGPSLRPAARVLPGTVLPSVPTGIGILLGMALDTRPGTTPRYWSTRPHHPVHPSLSSQYTPLQHDRTTRNRCQKENPRPHGS